MQKEVYNELGDRRLRVEQDEPECGKDFCDKCGDCLVCYIGDPCFVGNTDLHRWIEYVDDRESEPQAESD